MTVSGAVRLAYCAGLIDGEGYIGAARRMPSAANKMVSPRYSVRLYVSMADEAPVRFLADIIGVGDRVYFRDRRAKPNHSGQYILDLENERAAQLLRLVVPYLICKKQQAEYALALFNLRAESGRHRNAPRRCLDGPYLARCDALYLAMKRRTVSNNGVETRAI